MTMRTPSFATRLRASAVVFALAFSMTVFAAVYKPTSADEILLRVDPAQHQANLRLRSTDHADPIAAADAASALVALGRAQHDERYFGYASARLAPWTGDDQAPARIVLLTADIAQYQHRFNDALAILNRLTTREQTNPSALLMRAAIRLTQGDPRSARPDCQRLFALRETFSATVCMMQIASLTGQLENSYRTLLSLIERTPLDRATAEYAWAYGIAADMADRVGDLESSEKWLRNALTIAPTDLVSRLQLCDLLLRTNRASAASALIERYSPSDPILLRRALASQQLGNSVQAKTAFDAWQASIARSAQFGVTLHLRELALGQFELLHDPNLALQTALDNWRVQREPIDARLLARIARAAHNASAMQQVRDWQLQLHYEDKELDL